MWLALSFTLGFVTGAAFFLVIVMDWLPVPDDDEEEDSPVLNPKPTARSFENL